MRQGESGRPCSVPWDRSSSRHSGAPAHRECVQPDRPGRGTATSSFSPFRQTWLAPCPARPHRRRASPDGFAKNVCLEQRVVVDDLPQLGGEPTRCGKSAGIYLLIAHKTVSWHALCSRRKPLDGARMKHRTRCEKEQPLCVCRGCNTPLGNGWIFGRAELYPCDSRLVREGLLDNTPSRGLRADHSQCPAGVGLGPYRRDLCAQVLQCFAISEQNNAECEIDDR